MDGRHPVLPLLPGRLAPTGAPAPPCEPDRAVTFPGATASDSRGAASGPRAGDHESRVESGPRSAPAGASRRDRPAGTELSPVAPSTRPSGARGDAAGDVASGCPSSPTAAPYLPAAGGQRRADRTCLRGAVERDRSSVAAHPGPAREVWAAAFTPGPRAGDRATRAEPGPRPLDVRRVPRRGWP